VYPTLFRIGSFELSSFGAALAVAFLVAGWLAARNFPRTGLPSESAWRLLTWAMVGGVLGSKLWYVAEAVSRDPSLREVLFVPGGPLLSRGGITWYGGLVGGAIAVLAAARALRLPLDAVMQGTAASLAIGQAIGRVGCFLVGDDWGLPTNQPWGVAFPIGVEPTDVPVHPTQLYEAFWLFALCAWLWRRHGRSPSVFAEYLLLAGVGRLWIELYRHNPALIGPLSNAQLTALASIAVGALLWWRGRRALQRAE
jgi:phosphatidylglycerol:prolipoprotein diacylglycerol transferase